MKPAVIIPVKDDANRLWRAVAGILSGLPSNGFVIVVDDGSSEPASAAQAAGQVMTDKRVAVLRCDECGGPAAARNLGMEHARHLGAELAILLDADCLADSTFVPCHIALHADFGLPCCFGGAIQGQGQGFWSWIDGCASWFTSLPGSQPHAVRPPYHLPTTNLSFPLSLNLQFDARLKTGEDVAFIQDLRRLGVPVMFSPIPAVRHCDRESFSSMIRHQYRWGLHTFAVRSRERAASPFWRWMFIVGFFSLSPLYVLAATGLNMLPLLRVSPRHVLALPFLLALYSLKAVAVMHGALFPGAALFTPSPLR